MIEYRNTEEWIEVREPQEHYSTESINNSTYKIIGCCFEVHNQLGRGFSEVVYKDALEYEFKKNNIVYTRENKFEIRYKDIVLPHSYFADFVIESRIILEIKAQQELVDENIKQVLNYLAASKCEIGLLINFGQSSLKYKRIILK